MGQFAVSRGCHVGVGGSFGSGRKADQASGKG